MVQCACQVVWVLEVLGAPWVLGALWGLLVVWDPEDQAVMDPPAMAPEETWVATLAEVQWDRQEGVQWHLAIPIWGPEGKGQVRPQETLGCSKSPLQGP